MCIRVAYATVNIYILNGVLCYHGARDKQINNMMRNRKCNLSVIISFLKLYFDARPNPISFSNTNINSSVNSFCLRLNV